MFKITHIVALAASAAVITLGLVAAEAHDAKVRSGAPVAATAAAVVDRSPAEKAESGQATAEKIVQAPACARKVKVVYAGYGEGARADCPSATN